MNINKKEILKITGLVVLMIAVPVTFYLVRNQQIFRSGADFQNSYELVDASGQPLPSFQDGYKTTTSSITLNVTSIDVSPSPSLSSSPAASNNSSPSSSANPSPSGNGVTMYRVSFDSGFPQGQTYQGNLDANNQVTIDVVLPGDSGLKTVYLQFSDDVGNSWYPSTPRTAQVNLLVATSSPSPSPAASVSPSPSSSPATFKKVFVTSVAYDGNLGGLAGADSKCQIRATAANLTGTWKAWLSDSNTSAGSRLVHATVPYKLVDETLVANNWDDLVSGNLRHAINKTEINGDPPNTTSNSGAVTVWTYTQANGAMMVASKSCDNWTSNLIKGHAGNVSSTSSSWTDYTSGGICSGTSVLYCFEQ